MKETSLVLLGLVMESGLILSTQKPLIIISASSVINIG
jgi:hypothetical protein